MFAGLVNLLQTDCAGDNIIQNIAWFSMSLCELNKLKQSDERVKCYFWTWKVHIASFDVKHYVTKVANQHTTQIGKLIFFWTYRTGSVIVSSFWYFAIWSILTACVNYANDMKSKITFMIGHKWRSPKIECHRIKSIQHLYKSDIVFTFHLQWNIVAEYSMSIQIERLIGRGDI